MRMRATGIFVAILWAAGAAGVTVGETPSGAAEPATQAGTDAQFFAELGYKDVATASDTARALVVLASEGTEDKADFDQARAYLREKGILSGGWLDSAQADDPTDKGHLASLICRALGIKGGLWMRLFGPVPRYALRECVYLDLMTRGAEYAHVTGGELVGVIDRADRFRLAQTGQETPELTGRPSGAAPVPVRGTPVPVGGTPIGVGVEGTAEEKSE